MSIARSWSGATSAADADRYLEYLGRTGLRDLAATPGNEGVLALRRVDGERAEFTIVSLWRREHDVEAFAGVPVERAVFYPEDEEFLLERDEEARHYEVVFFRPAAPEKRAPERWTARLARWWTDWARRAIPAPRT